MKKTASVASAVGLAAAWLLVGACTPGATAPQGISSQRPVSPNQTQVCFTGLVMQTVKTGGAVTSFNIRTSCTGTLTIAVTPNTTYMDDKGKPLAVTDIKYESLISTSLPLNAQSPTATVIVKRPTATLTGLVTGVGTTNGAVSSFTMLNKSGSTTFPVGPSTFFYKLAQGTPGYATDITAGMGINVTFWDGTASSGAFFLESEVPQCYSGVVSSVTKTGTAVTGFMIPGHTITTDAKTAYINYVSAGPVLCSPGIVTTGTTIKAWYLSLSKPAVTIVLNPPGAGGTSVSHKQRPGNASQ